MYTVQPLQCIFNSPFHVCAAAVYKRAVFDSSDDRYSSTAIRTHRAHSIRQSEKWTMSHANNAVTWGRCQLHSLQLLGHHQSAPDLEQATPRLYQHWLIICCIMMVSRSGSGIFRAKWERGEVGLGTEVTYQAV